MTWRYRAGYFRTSGRGTTPDMATKSPLFCFSPRLLSTLAWTRHSCQLTSLSSAPVFCLTAITSPPCFLTSLLRSLTRLVCRGCKVSPTLLWILGLPHRFLRQYPPSGEHPSWHMAWRGGCRQSSLAKRVVSGLFIFCVY